MRSATLIGLVTAVLIITHGAYARDDAGKLDLLRVPNNGQPVVARAGDNFEVILLAESELQLELDGSFFPLPVSWQEERGERVYGEARLPKALASGCYALHAVKGETRDINLRSVYVVDALPDTYAFAHLTDMHTGTKRHQRSDRDILLEIIGQVNASDADFTIITGDLTDHGTAEEFASFLDIVDTCRMPTFVTPGNHDRTDSNYADYFERLTYAFCYGEDGYLSFDTKDYLIADEMDVQNPRLYVYRRALRACRWSVGITHRYDPDMGIRAQLILFVDDPLDYLLVGHTHREARVSDQIPWGKTRLVMTPAAINGSWRLVRVDNQGLHQEATESSVSIRPLEEETDQKDVRTEPGADAGTEATEEEE
jgi:predicted phosphodiesterase